MLSTQDDIELHGELYGRWEIPCDGPRIWPERIQPHDTHAEWVGVKGCGHSRLLCSPCKELYLELTAQHTGFVCHDCGTRNETKFITFERLGRA